MAPVANGEVTSRGVEPHGSPPEGIFLGGVAGSCQLRLGGARPPVSKMEGGQPGLGTGWGGSAGGSPPAVRPLMRLQMLLVLCDGAHSFLVPGTRVSAMEVVYQHMFCVLETLLSCLLQEEA